MLAQGSREITHPTRNGSAQERLIVYENAVAEVVSLVMSFFCCFGNAHQVIDEMSEMKIDSLERVLKPGYVCALCVSHIYMFIFKI